MSILEKFVFFKHLGLNVTCHVLVLIIPAHKLDDKKESGIH